MSDITVTCPHCREPFQLTRALAEPMLEAERRKLHAEVEQQIASVREQSEAATKDAIAKAISDERQAAKAAMAERDAQLEAAKKAELVALQAKEAADRERRDIGLEVQRQVEVRSSEIAARASEQAKGEAATQLEAMKAQLAAKDEKLKAAQLAELQALKLKTEAEEAKREVDLTVAQRLDEERTKVREAAFKQRDDEHRLKVAEKDRQLDAMREQIEELRRKGNAASQQLVGDVAEQDLMEQLQQAFPSDRFERIAKGQNGGDLIQTIMSATGAPSGTILWESKRTKTWQNAWLSKLREDQRAVTADIAVLATETLPSEVRTFGPMSGIWVTAMSTVVPVAQALRQGLIEVAATRRAGAMADTAKDKIFEYLVTTPFRQRMARAVEAYEELRSDLDKEKRAMNALWNRREKQLDRISGGLGGLYGDLRGIVGSSMPTIEKLELPSAEKPHLAMVAGSDVAPGNQEGDT